MFFNHFFIFVIFAVLFFQGNDAVTGDRSPGRTRAGCQLSSLALMDQHSVQYDEWR